MTKREPWNPLLKSYPESEKINACSTDAETMYTRLIAKSDDRGNYYGDPLLMASYLYGHRLANGTMDAHRVASMRDELVSNSLLVRYAVGGKEYVHVVNVKKALRRDVKLDVRFPEYTQAVEIKGHPEPVTNTARTRNEPGTGPGRLPNPTQPNPTHHQSNNGLFSKPAISSRLDRLAPNRKGEVVAEIKRGLDGGGIKAPLQYALKIIDRHIEEERAERGRRAEAKQREPQKVSIPIGKYSEEERQGIEEQYAATGLSVKWTGQPPEPKDEVPF